MLQILRRHTLVNQSISGTAPAYVGSTLRQWRLPPVVQGEHHKRFTTTEPIFGQREEKPYYVTTPIFYVNAAPHVGHLYSMVLADIIKRWQQLKGRRALLCTGTDEHGMKVQRAAIAAHSDPKAFCDKGSETFQNLAAEGGISNDHFIRTTDDAHREAVQYAWTLLEERGHIYLSKHEGWYSVSDETFYPQSGVHLIVEPSSGRKIMASIETGKEVEWTSETNYRFRLSAFKNQLLSLYRRNPDFIIPSPRMNDVVRAVEAGLEDLSISRPRQRLSWGIPVPRDESQTIYVWLDALINYITKTGYPWAPDAENVGGWPADVQVIGKDIVRFHCIYWPAFLMALDIPTPRKVLSHAHWTLGREKMSKSTGNVVNPFFALKRFGIDAMRFYLAHDGGISDDADYSNEYIIERYKKILQGGLGNLTSRVLRGRGWDVRRAVVAETTGQLNLKDDVMARSHARMLREKSAEVVRKMDSHDIGGAMKAIVYMIFKTNTFMQAGAPWHLAKQLRINAKNKAYNDIDLRNEMDRMIFQCAETLRLTAILLLPVMPGKMNELLDMLGVAEDKRNVKAVEFKGDGGYGISKVDLGHGHVGALFPPLASEE